MVRLQKLPFHSLPPHHQGSRTTTVNSRHKIYNTEWSYTGLDKTEQGTGVKGMNIKKEERYNCPCGKLQRINWKTPGTNKWVGRYWRQRRRMTRTERGRHGHQSGRTGCTVQEGHAATFYLPTTYWLNDLQRNNKISHQSPMPQEVQRWLIPTQKHLEKEIPGVV